MKTKRKKTFDCVEMKDKAAQPINSMLLGLSVEDQLKYWNNRKSKIDSTLNNLVSAKQD